jgi:subtilase family serine protease
MSCVRAQLFSDRLERTKLAVEMDGMMAMVRKSALFAQLVAALPLAGVGLLGLGSPLSAGAQAIPRITSQVENSALVSLPNSVHPWARAQFDRGPAPANMSGRMVLVLKRSPEQEAALQTLLAAQQDPHSPNYHKWLTPEDFGKRFGVADADLQTVSGYLSAQGMSVGRVYGNHMAIEVSATAGQIKSTFQTEIHTYSVAGKTFYANNSNPKIPSALHSVVSGFAALNNFRAAGGSGAGAQGTLDRGTHTIKPLYTTGTSPNFTYGISPGDLDVIYDIPAATAQGNGGQNVNVGVIGDSDINVSYVNNYRSIFGLSANPPVVVVDGNDPGVNDDAYIAYKQIELVGAVAPNATIYYYTSATTDYDTGLDFALIRAVTDNHIQVLVLGFQSCETALGATGMFLVNQVTEEAAAQGMTVVAASGDTGAAGCEVPGTVGKATTGYAVNGYASSPYVTAVGGTDFFYSTLTPATTYWNNTNSGTPSYTSAKSYIPEQVWNDSYAPGGTGTSNSVNGTSVELSSGGGPSTAGSDGVSVAQKIPSYQAGKINGISSTARVIPDISFFAGSGANQTEGYNNSAYLFCMQPADCQTTGTPQFTYSGGTEASSAVFAGAVALAVNKLNSSSRFGLGNINPSLYSMMGVTIAPHDIILGNNELACTGSNNCSGGHMTGYAAGVGYDAATGFGSFDITSFVTYYAPSGTTPSSVALTIIDPLTGKAPVCGTTPNCTTHSTWLQFTVTASPASGTGTTPTGDVDIFTSSPLQADTTVGTLTLTSGTATTTSDLLPGGTYNLYARYAGDGTYASSVGNGNPATLTVQPEACQMVVYGHNINIGANTNIPYGTPISITAEPYSHLSTNNDGIPSGSIQVLDNTKLITTLPINSEGAATFTSNLLPVSATQHQIVLNYPGDASFTSCQTGAFLATITKAATTTVLNSPELDTGDSGSNQTLGVTAIVTSATLPSNGIAPTGTVTFSTKTPKTVTLTPGFDANGNAIATASTTVGTSDIPTGGGGITATYLPGSDPNYTGSVSSAANFYESIANTNTSSTTTFTITDNHGTYPATGSFPTTPNPSFPALDSITLNMKVTATNPNDTVFLVYANGVLLTPATWSGGFINNPCGLNPPPCSGVAISANGTATFTIPQQNGYLALPSGPVQFTVVYDGWYGTAQTGCPFRCTTTSVQSNPSSANQIVNIVDDRTSADFSLQTDTTVNQPAPLVASTGITEATYNLRLTSIYNFVSAYSTTPINLSCSITGYSLAGVRSTVPAGLACGFSSLLTSSTTSVQFSTTGNTGFISQQLFVGAASGYAIGSNTVPAQPATRWWIASGGTTLACIFLLGLPARRRKWQSLLGACVLMIVGFGISGCGATVANGPNQSYYDNLNNGSGSGNGSGNGQTSPATVVPAGTYTVLVTATATTNTTLIHTLPVEVLVGTTN